MMSKPNAICYKIDEIVANLQKAIQTEGKGFDAIQATETLHEIRLMAQRMEAGLALRKEILEKHHLEEAYQKKKKEYFTPTKLGVNKLIKEKRKADEPLDIEVTIKEKGTIVYQAPANAVLMAVVEEITDIDVTTGEIYGRTQKVFAGSEVAQLFGYDQMRQAFESMKTELMMKAIATLENKKWLDPQFKQSVIDGANNKILKTPVTIP